MALLNRVSNVLGLSTSPRRTHWWPVGLLAMAVPLAIWLASMSIVDADDSARGQVKDGRPAGGLQLGLSIEDQTTTLKQGRDRWTTFQHNCQPRELTLEFRNVGRAPFQLDTYYWTQRLLSFEVIGPEIDSVKTKPYVREGRPASARARDFPTLKPGETWTVKFHFPGVFSQTAYGLLQPGDYQIRAVYESGPDSPKATWVRETLREAYRGRWQGGKVKSNAVTLKVGPMVAVPVPVAPPKPNLELMLVPERTTLVMKTGASNPEPIKLGLRFTNSTDKPLKLDTYLFARCHLGAHIAGPDEDSVDYHSVDVSAELPQPMAEQFITIQPGQSWTTYVFFPGEFTARSYALAKLGHYRLRMHYYHSRNALPMVTSTARNLSYDELQKLREQYKELTDKLGDVCKGCWQGTARSNEIVLRALPERGPEPGQDAARYRTLYARYKGLIADAARSGDKVQVLKITEQFNDSIGGQLIYAGVSQSGSSVINRSFGREPFPLPAISYDATDSGKEKVSLFKDFFLVETANPGDLDKVRVRLAFAAVVGFGQVKERVLPFGVPCAMYLFQFRNGEVFVSGHGPGTTEREAAQDQKKIEDAGGVDLCAHGGEAGFQVVGEGCLFTRDLRGLSWEKTTAKEVEAKMKQVNFVNRRKAKDPSDPFAAATGGGSGLVEQEAKDLPITYLVKTARGEVGVMEVLDVVEDERGHSGDGKGYGMKFRYKLVQPIGAIAPL